MRLSLASDLLTIVLAAAYMIYGAFDQSGAADLWRSFGASILLLSAVNIVGEAQRRRRK